ncbi:hypothetical protein Hanom_Chr15g01345301 [Helianthus anomalus]
MSANQGPLFLQMIWCDHMKPTCLNMLLICFPIAPISNNPRPVLICFAFPDRMKSHSVM